MSYSRTFTTAIDKLEKILERPLTEEEKKSFIELVAWIWDESKTYDPRWDSD